MKPLAKPAGRISDGVTVVYIRPCLLQFNPPSPSPPSLLANHACLSFSRGREEEEGEEERRRGRETEREREIMHASSLSFVINVRNTIDSFYSSVSYKRMMKVHFHS